LQSLKAGAQAGEGGAAAVFGRLALCALTLLLWLLPGLAYADDRAKLFATTEKGFGRLIIDFPARLDLPSYKVHSDNGVLSIEFATPVDLTLPDVAAALPDYVTVARIDPDHKGVRFGLRTTLTVNQIEAGEQLFVDLMPTDWQGLPPGLPPEVVARLAERAKQAAILAEQQRKAEAARISKPVATVRVGRNPTFMRVEFSWNVDTKATFALDGNTGDLDFDWPVPVDLHLLKTGLPDEVRRIDTLVTPDGSRIVFAVAPKVVPRFYAVSSRDFIVDIDTASTVPANPNPVAATTASAWADALANGTKTDTSKPAPSGLAAWAAPGLPVLNLAPQGPITPEVTTVGSTIRITFPFDRETPAAVFRRGDTVWMLFDTLTAINQPAFSGGLASLADGFTVVPTGSTQVVRLDLGADKLATLGSEGKAWVLSIGDMLLAPAAPIVLTRRTDRHGLYEIAAALDRPGRVHRFTDPVVGDTLSIVTAFPPARGLARDLAYVDFEALRSVQGLVIRPEHDDVGVTIDGRQAVIASPAGLTVSPPEALQLAAGTAPAVSRDGFIDLASLREDNPVKFNARVEALTETAAHADGNSARNAARMDLARYYLANRYGYEAIGVLGVLQRDVKTDDRKRDAQLLLAAADVAAGRAAEALPILNAPAFADEVDARMWRSIAEADANDYAAARRDALAAEEVVASYPAWVRTRFLLTAVRSALETDDTVSAERFYHAIDFADLNPEQASLYQLLGGRIAEAEGRTDEALDTYGQVIAADFRPTRAEAVYRTILVLDKTGKVDAAKATRTLAAEAMLWRGNTLESKMDSLLAGLYFRSGQFRLGFETAKQTVASFPSSPAMDALGSEAQHQFEALYLDGGADRMRPVEALALFYDFRDLTPPGARGDRMIRNLAERLVKVDLLSQAADLLRYQIDHRLKGAAAAQIATELAVIDIANRDPEDALKVLNRTELAELPPSMQRQRRLLEARALIDSSRDDLALDVLGALTGRDADRLRVEANWAAKRYEAAGALIETMYAADLADSGGPGLNEAGRMDLVRAAVAYALANDRLSLSRLRAKFADSLARGPEWAMFDYVTSSIEPTSSPEFAEVARAVSGIDSLEAFLAGYREVYGQDADMTPGKASPALGTTPVAASGAPTPSAG
jgi:hypothetical protein